jgi:Uma2 family endonuclease
MTAVAGGALDAIEHLPAGSTLLVPDVSWAEYESLLSQLGEGYPVRIQYDRGSLSIMSPSARHEKCKELILRIADAIADERGFDLESFGSTTFKNRELEKGAEPDTCFYVQSAAAVAGKTGLDPAVDPPPDVVVEIDLAHASEDQFPFYAALRAPELWLYDGERVRIYHLTSQGYEIAQASRAFPILTGLVLTRFMAEGQSGPERAVLRSVRQWIRAEREVQDE